MKLCRVCGGKLGPPAYNAPAPALTSIMTLLDVPTIVHLCEKCGHAQCEEIPDIQAFYDTGYRISLNSEDHDQIFAVNPDGTVVFRTERQAEIALALLDLAPSSSVLDYGAAKAETLRKMTAARPDIRPHVFDVSADYQPAWQGWVAAADQATYAVPERWQGRFDAVMSHFVIEHVADPVGFVAGIRELLKPGGKLLLSMPDVSANPGDMIVADHVNHFSEASLRRALAAGGFKVMTLDKGSFPGAFFVMATRQEAAVEHEQSMALVQQAINEGREICQLWTALSAALGRQAIRLRGRKSAIYGAGFYGSWIYSQVREELDIEAFVDRNPKLQNTRLFDHPVIGPADLADDIEALLVGLNPLKASAAMEGVRPLLNPNAELIWLSADQ